MINNTIIGMCMIQCHNTASKTKNNKRADHPVPDISRDRSAVCRKPLQHPGPTAVHEPTNRAATAKCQSPPTLTAASRYMS